MGKIVKLHNINKQDTPLFINGRGVSVPHNVDFPLADNYVELLSNSGANFTIQGEVPDAECAGFDGPVGAEAEAGGSEASAPELIAEDAPVEAPIDAPVEDPLTPIYPPVVPEQAPAETPSPLTEGETPPAEQFDAV